MPVLTEAEQYLSAKRRFVFYKLYEAHKFEADVLEDGNLEDDGCGRYSLPVFLDNPGGDSIRTEFVVHFHDNTAIPVDSTTGDDEPVETVSFPTRVKSTPVTDIRQVAHDLKLLSGKLEDFLETRNKPLEQDILDIFEMAQNLVRLSGTEYAEVMVAREQEQGRGYLGAAHVQAVDY